MPTTRTIPAYQHAHVQQVLTAYAKEHALSFAAMSRLTNTGEGSIAAIVRPNAHSPSLLFVRRLASGLGLTEEELLGPPEPLYEESQLQFMTCADHRPAAVPEADWQECHDHMTLLLEACLGELKDMHTILLAMWDRMLRTP